MVMDWDKHLPSILAWGGAVVTGIFTLLGVWFANRNSIEQLTVKLQHEWARESRESLRARLEELYSLVGRWAAEVVIHHVTYRKVMDGELTYNQALDLTLKNKSSVDANRMFTLAELYFPSAHGALQELKELRDDAAAIQSSFNAGGELCPFRAANVSNNPNQKFQDEVTCSTRQVRKALPKLASTVLGRSMVIFLMPSA
jgi:hypothetical protein